MKAHPQSHYEAVAREYVAALERGDKPGKAVMRAHDCTSSVAYRWIKRAREMGLLDETVPRVVPNAYMTNMKLRAVADALGVTPHALFAAVLTHAGGDLRVSGRGQGAVEALRSGRGCADRSGSKAVLSERSQHRESSALFRAHPQPLRRALSAGPLASVSPAGSVPATLEEVEGEADALLALGPLTRDFCETCHKPLHARDRVERMVGEPEYESEYGGFSAVFSTYCRKDAPA